MTTGIEKDIGAMRSILSIAFIFIATWSMALPNDADFRVITNFPKPADDASGVVGTAIPDGRFLVWNGDTVFLQREVGSGLFDPIAAGYSGDPGFVALNPAGDGVLLGAGFGDGTNANVYPFDFAAPQDFSPGNEIVVPSHFSGTFLNSSLVAFDRGDFGSPAEIIVLDLFSTARGERRVVTVIERPPSATRDTVITKPSGSFSASVSVHGGLLYVADAGNGQYKTFSVTDVVNAFNSSTTLAWSSGTDLGAPFDYPLGGVSGITPSGNLVMAGSGSIAEVDPSTEGIVDTIAPGGSSAFYGVVYNGVTGEPVAIEFPATFGDPLTFHATANGVASLPAAGWIALAVLLFAGAGLMVVALRGPRPHARRGLGRSG